PQEAAVEPLILPAEVLPLPLDLRDCPLAEEDSQWVVVLRTQRTGCAKVRLPQRVRRAKPLCGGNSGDRQRCRILQRALGLTLLAEVVIHRGAQGWVDFSRVVEPGSRVPAVGRVGSAVADIKRAQLVHYTQDRGMRLRQSSREQL